MHQTLLNRNSLMVQLVRLRFLHASRFLLVFFWFGMWCEASESDASACPCDCDIPCCRASSHCTICSVWFSPRPSMKSVGLKTPESKCENTSWLCQFLTGCRGNSVTQMCVQRFCTLLHGVLQGHRLDPYYRCYAYRA